MGGVHPNAPVWWGEGADRQQVGTAEFYGYGRVVVTIANPLIEQYIAESNMGGISIGDPEKLEAAKAKDKYLYGE